MPQNSPTALAASPGDSALLPGPLPAPAAPPALARSAQAAAVAPGSGHRMAAMTHQGSDSSPGGLSTGPGGRRIPALTGRQKAAILVRLLLEEGAELPLSALPEEMQTSLTEQIAALRLVDRETLHSVVREFVETLEQVGLSFSGGIEAALDRLGDRLSPAAAERLRRTARARGAGSPWDGIAQAQDEDLLPLLAQEGAEVSAVVLSKLNTAKAAGLLGQMPGDRARRIACAMPLTESIAPRVVARIGASLARQLDERPRPAFAASPGERFGAILNAVPSDQRDSLLRDLEGDDAGFAQDVRRNIFTFAHIPERINPRDVPRILREVAQDELITALAAALSAPDSPEGAAAEFLLANMSQRLAGALRDEVEGMGPVKAKNAEAAQNTVVAAIRTLLDDGTIALADDAA